MINLSLEKVELLKKRIYVYKEKVKIASNCAMDIKRKTTQKRGESISLRRDKRALENSFISKESN